MFKLHGGLGRFHPTAPALNSPSSVCHGAGSPPSSTATSARCGGHCPGHASVSLALRDVEGARRGWDVETGAEGSGVEMG